MWMIRELNNKDFINSSTKLLPCELYHQSKLYRYGFTFHTKDIGVMINGRLIIYYPYNVDGDLDGVRAVVYKTNNIRRKDIVLNQISVDIISLSEEIIKVCD